ncbi:MAG: hypothetical protein ABR990_03445 [Terracidiphilus sp.]|jgi:hypothetical protein
MRIRKLIIVNFIILFIASVQGQQEQRWVLLPASEVAAVANFYPLNGPEKIKGSWQPSKMDLESLDANIPQIAGMNIKGWPSIIHIDHPEVYFRQYVPVFQSGEKRIFVNAFCDVQDEPNWRSRLVIVSDGATCFWHTLYDPATKKFTILYINPRA